MRRGSVSREQLHSVVIDSSGSYARTLFICLVHTAVSNNGTLKRWKLRNFYNSGLRKMYFNENLLFLGYGPTAYGHSRKFTTYMYEVRITFMGYIMLSLKVSQVMWVSDWRGAWTRLTEMTEKCSERPMWGWVRRTTKGLQEMINLIGEWLALIPRKSKSYNVVSRVARSAAF